MAIPAKNVCVSQKLLADMSAAAQAEGKTTDELFEEAARRLLEHRGLDALAERGREHARALGRQRSDAVRLTREFRAERKR
jgi:hypothetical protein